MYIYIYIYIYISKLSFYHKAPHWRHDISASDDSYSTPNITKLISIYNISKIHDWFGFRLRQVDQYYTWRDDATTLIQYFEIWCFSIFVCFSSELPYHTHTSSCINEHMCWVFNSLCGWYNLISFECNWLMVLVQRTERCSLFIMSNWNDYLFNLFYYTWEIFRPLLWWSQRGRCYTRPLLPAQP